MENCIFCQIVNHTLPANILYEDDLVVVIKDRTPLAPIHLLLISKQHYDSINQIQAGQEEMLGKLLIAARKIAFDQGIGESGYRLVINTGKQGGQTVFHLHIHILGGGPLGVDLITRGLK